jgi:hypothetical protein
MVTEAYEMIPFAQLKRGQKPVTKLTRLAPDGSSAGALTAEAGVAKAILIDNDGYGVRIELDWLRSVLLGQQNTVLIELAGKNSTGDKPVPASSVGLSYRLIPYAGEAVSGAAPASVEYGLPQLGELDSLDKAARALAEQKPFVVKTRDRVLAEVRLAVAGNDLAIAANVRDPKVVQNPAAWKASCIEVFGSMPGQTRIGQIFLVPQAGDAPAKAYLNKDGKQAPVPEIRLQSGVSEGGYEMRALVPLRLLAADPAKAAFLLEFQVTVSESASSKGEVVRATLFGSSLAYMDNSRYGLFKIGGPGKEEGK